MPSDGLHVLAGREAGRGRGSSYRKLSQTVGAEDSDAVILTAAGSDSIGLATRAFADRGTVVVAGVTTALMDLGLYPDIHRRGLRLVRSGSSIGGRTDSETFARLARIVELRMIAAEP